MMKRMLRWLFLGLILVEIGLVRLGLIDLRTATLVVLGIEALLLLIGLGFALSGARRFRSARAMGVDPWLALTTGLAELLPLPIARLVANEIRLFSDIGHWLRRRNTPAAGEFGYTKRSAMGALIVLLMLTAPVEIFLIEFLLPWAWLRWVLLLLSIYSVVWLIGLYAAMQVRHHRVTDSAVHLASGMMATAELPLAEITAVSMHHQRHPDVRDGLVVTDDGTARFAIGGHTDVDITLSTPTTAATLLRPASAATRYQVAVDAPEAFVAAIAAHRQGTALVADSPPPLSATSPPALATP